MGLLETIVLGSYLYTTAFCAAIYRLLTRNHVKHIDDRLTKVEKHLHLRD